MKKFLVWHQGALGDLILSFPSLHAIKRSRKDYFIHLVSRGDLGDIIVRNRLADEVTLNESGIFSDLFTGGVSVSPALRDFFEDADEAFVFMRKQDDIFMKNIRLYVPGTFFVETVPPDGRRKHVARHQMGQLKPAGINLDMEMPALDYPSASPFPPGEKRAVTIHPGSGGKKKCWPIDKFIDLAASLHSADSFSFRWISGPAEDRSVTERTCDYLSEKGIDVGIFADISLSEAASLIKSSSLFIGNDSGITHLASALGTPCIALFGPTDHRVWGPLGENVKIVRSSYPCSPCMEDRYRKCSRVLCMESLKTGKVLSAAEALLNRNVRREKVPRGVELQFY